MPERLSDLLPATLPDMLPEALPDRLGTGGGGGMGTGTTSSTPQRGQLPLRPAKASSIFSLRPQFLQ